MSVHADFYDFLGTLDEGDQLQAAYDTYKAAPDGVAFALNGLLKEGKQPEGAEATLYNNLKKVIRARNNTEATLYRMTAESQIDIPTGLGDEFVYRAFFSTAGKQEAVAQFAKEEKQILIEVRCPAGTPMGLMERDDGMEDEHLLGCGTKFRVVSKDVITDEESLSTYLGIGHQQKELPRVVLEVTENPDYTTDLSPFPFDKEDHNPNVEYI